MPARVALAGVVEEPREQLAIRRPRERAAVHDRVGEVEVGVPVDLVEVPLGVERRPRDERDPVADAALQRRREADLRPRLVGRGERLRHLRVEREVPGGVGRVHARRPAGAVARLEPERGRLRQPPHQRPGARVLPGRARVPGQGGVGVRVEHGGVDPHEQRAVGAVRTRLRVPRRVQRNLEPVGEGEVVTGRQRGRGHGSCRRRRDNSKHCRREHGPDPSTPHLSAAYRLQSRLRPRNS